MIDVLPRIRFSPPVNGMNSVDNPKNLRDTECLSLVNAYPGVVPEPRKGCSGEFINSSTNWKFCAPAKRFDDGTNTWVIAWVYTGSMGNYLLLKIPDDNDGTAVSCFLGTASFGSTPVFGMINAFDCLYAFTQPYMGAWGSTAALGHKVIESDGETIRDASISVAASVFSVSHTGDDVTPGPFSVGEFHGYAFTYVRRNDADAFDNTYSDPNLELIVPAGISSTSAAFIDTYLPGVLEGIHSVANDESHEITNTGSTKYYRTINIQITGQHLTPIQMGATHLRVYRTTAQTSAEDALAATKYYVADLPLNYITGDTPPLKDLTFDDTYSDASLDEEVFLTMSAYTSMPLAEYVEYCNLRMWLYVNGKGYYSEIPGGDGGCDLDLAVQHPQKFASMFKPLSYFVDIDSAESTDSRGVARLNNDLYFFKKSKFYTLFGGDPLVGVPTMVSDTVGCWFPHTITKCDVEGVFGNCLLLISNKGPLIIEEGGRERLFSEFKIAELWPNKTSGSGTGELFAAAETDEDWMINHAYAEYWGNTWWVCYETSAGVGKVFGYYFDPDNARSSGESARGSFKLDIADVVNGEDTISQNILMVIPKSSRVAQYLAHAGGDVTGCVVGSFLGNSLYQDELGNLA